MSKVTAEARAPEYVPEHQLTVNKKHQLLCKCCNVIVDHTRKSSVDNHIKSQMHRRAMSRALNQQTAQAGSGLTKERFHQDLLLAFASANIPLHKLQFNQFKFILNKYMLPEFQLPSSTTVRGQLEPVFAKHLQKTSDLLKTKKLAIITDESTDMMQRYVLHVLVKILGDTSGRERNKR
jgi:hypothetical protein